MRQAFLDYLVEEEERERALDSAPAESSSAVHDPDTIAREAILAYVQTAPTRDGQSSRTAERWLRGQGQNTWDAATGLLTPDATRLLKPVAQTLAVMAPELRRLGGIDVEPIARKLFERPLGSPAWPVLEQWLAETGIRVLTASETVVARALDLARSILDDTGEEPGPTNIASKILGGPATRDDHAKFAGYLEAAGHDVEEGFTVSQMMVAVAARLASFHSIANVSHRDIAVAVFGRGASQPQVMRVRGWATATWYLDSLGGLPSRYARFVHSVVATAQDLRRQDGTVDIAEVATATLVESTASDASRSAASPAQRAAVRFWLERAGVDGLVDTAQAPGQEAVWAFPSRSGIGVSGKILRLTGDVRPPRPDQSTGSGELTEYVIWRAAELAARGEPVTVKSLAAEAFAENPATRKQYVTTAAILEISGLGALVRRKEPLGELMGLALTEARQQLLDRGLVDISEIAKRLPTAQDYNYVRQLLVAWFETVGLWGDVQVAPHGVIGRLRREVRDAAARDVAEGRVPDAVDIARRVFQEPTPSSVHVAVVSEWIAEDPRKLRTLGTVRSSAAKGHFVTFQELAGHVFKTGLPTRKDVRQVSDWLVEWGVLDAADSLEPTADLVPLITASVVESAAPSSGDEERPTLQEVAREAETRAYKGVSLPELAQAVSTALPLAPRDLQRYVHRLMLEHAPTYRLHFEAALSVIHDPELTNAQATHRLIEFATSVRLHPSVVSAWMDHVDGIIETRGRFAHLSQRALTALQAEASGYLNAVIGGVSVEPVSVTAGLLYEERLMRVALALDMGGAYRATSEADEIGREMNIPGPTRLVGGATRAQGFQDFLDGFDEPEQAMDGIVAESSAMAGLPPEQGFLALLDDDAWDQTGGEDDAPDQLGPEDLLEQIALRAFVRATDQSGDWAGNTAQEWMEARDREVWDSARDDLTQEAAHVLKPLARTLALESTELARWGGVNATSLATRLFRSARVQDGVFLLAEWLEESGVSVLSEGETLAARTLYHVGPFAPSKLFSVSQIVREVFAQDTEGAKATATEVTGHLEAAGYKMRARATIHQLVVAVAAQEASEYAGNTVLPSDIIRSLLDLDPANRSGESRRVRAWRDASRYLDGFGGAPSRYATFVADVVRRAQETRRTDGTIDIAQVAADSFTVQPGSRQSVSPEHQRAAVRFWLEEAGVDGLVDSAEGSKPAPVSLFPPRQPAAAIFPPRRRGAAAMIMALVQGNEPAQPSGQGSTPSERADYVVWKAAGIASRGNQVTIRKVASLVYPSAYSGRLDSITAGVLEGSGLGYLIPGKRMMSPLMGRAFTEARTALWEGRQVLPGNVAHRLTGSSGTGKDYILGWFQAAGLVGGPINPNGPVGLMRGLTRALADARRAEGGEPDPVDLARRVLDVESPDPQQIAVITEWLDEDPLKAQAVGLARRFTREDDSLTGSRLISRVVSAMKAGPGEAQRIRDWLVEEAALRDRPVLTVESAEAVPGTADHSDVSVEFEESTLEEAEQQLLPSLAAYAETMVYKGTPLHVIADDLSYSLPMTPADLLGYTHRLMLEHASQYQRDFERMFEVLEATGAGSAERSRDLDRFASDRRMDASVVRMWERFYQDLIDLQVVWALPPKDAQAMRLKVATYLNERIGVVSVAPRSVSAGL
ncbi:hypothetical protein, partial [Streptomyces sp. NPDC058548]|uniref:hypothetical protein n=1 Tax=unclassified Streptomyces TaxID=2593676 RepID=UPI00364B84D6